MCCQHTIHGYEMGSVHWSIRTYWKPWLEGCCELMLRSHARNGAMLEQCSALAWRSDDTMGAYEVSVEKSLEVAGTIHLPGAAEGETPGERRRGGGWVIPYCATAPPSDARECCTLRSFWLCPCCCSARCLWLCHTGDRRGRSHLGERWFAFMIGQIWVLLSSKAGFCVVFTENWENRV